MYYNIKIYSKNAEFGMESQDRAIIEAEMDSYFSEFFSASEEFKSRIKRVVINRPEVRSIHDICLDKANITSESIAKQLSGDKEIEFQTEEAIFSDIVEIKDENDISIEDITYAPLFKDSTPISDTTATEATLNLQTEIPTPQFEQNIPNTLAEIPTEKNIESSLVFSNEQTPIKDSLIKQTSVENKIEEHKLDTDSDKITFTNTLLQEINTDIKDSVLGITEINASDKILFQNDGGLYQEKENTNKDDEIDLNDLKTISNITKDGLIKDDDLIGLDIEKPVNIKTETTQDYPSEFSVSDFIQSTQSKINMLDLDKESNLTNDNKEVCKIDKQINNESIDTFEEIDLSDGTINSAQSFLNDAQKFSKEADNSNQASTGINLNSSRELDLDFLHTEVPKQDNAPLFEQQEQNKTIELQDITTDTPLQQETTTSSANEQKVDVLAAFKTSAYEAAHKDIPTIPELTGFGDTINTNATLMPTQAPIQSEVPAIILQEQTPKEQQSVNTEASHDFSDFIKNFTCNSVLDELLICSYYIKNYTEQEDFTIKSINAKIFRATGKIAGMSILNELLEKGYISMIEDGDIKKYSISEKGEEYFINTYQG